MRDSVASVWCSARRKGLSLAGGQGFRGLRSAHRTPKGESERAEPAPPNERTNERKATEFVGIIFDVLEDWVVGDGGA